MTRSGAPAAGDAAAEKKLSRSNEAASSHQSIPIKPLKPRRGLFVLSLCVFAAWVGVLLWVYFTTVYPSRHTPTQPPRPRATVPTLAFRR